MLILPSWMISSAYSEPLREWGVRIFNDGIDDIAPNSVLQERYPQDNIWIASGQVLSPGFVNTHTHLYGVLAHGIPLTKAPAGFRPFLEEFWWPLVEDRLDTAMICCATDLRCAQMLHSGVTTFYDCTEAPRAIPGALQEQGEVVIRYGLRAILSFEATERVSLENGQLGLRENSQFIDLCKQNHGSLISGMMCFHTTFTCSESFIRQAFELAAERNVLVHMHLSEGNYEPEYAMCKFGMRPVQYYDHLGVTGSQMLASQCVQIDQKEIGILADRGVRVAHMPLSNCEVGGGIAPVPDLIQKGVLLGLGTDGYIDDFFEVMRGAFLIHKAHHQDARLMPAHLVWGLATEGGARVLGLERVGRIEVGWQADLQLIEIESIPTPLAAHNLFEQLLLYRNSSHVRGVMVAGKVKMRDGEILGTDLPALIAHTQEAAYKLWS